MSIQSKLLSALTLCVLGLCLCCLGWFLFAQVFLQVGEVGQFLVGGCTCSLVALGTGCFCAGLEYLETMFAGLT